MTLEGLTFRMWATKRPENYYWGFGDKPIAEMYCEEEDVLVEVDVTIDAKGSYWAMYMFEDNKPNFIYPNEPCFRVCFPYGPEDEEERGRGKIVKCNVKEVK